MWNQKDEETIKEARKLYTHTETKIDKIAEKLGVCRTTIFHWAKQYGWERFKRDFCVRTKYRKAAENKLGRKLQLYEQVHHLDGDFTNNDVNNLTVFANASKHTIAHKSLEKCAFVLYKKGFIKFNELTGEYCLGGDNK